MSISSQANGSRFAREVDLRAVIERVFAAPFNRFGWFLAIALLTRLSAFGDPSYHNDESLFFLIGMRMHDGLLPYVDIWDRKGPGLFLIYYLITGISSSIVAYQVAACLFAMTTAVVIGRISEPFAGRLGALLGGTFYLVMLPLFQGGGGEAPVFYNLFVALAAWAVCSRIPDLRAGRVGPALHLAMASAGFAITFKQTAAIEGAFIGCIVLWQLHRGGMPLARVLAKAIGLTLAGAAPMLAFAAIYAAIGHFPELWNALVTSNLAKTYNPAQDALKRIGSFAVIAGPLALPALTTLALPARTGDATVPRMLLAGWLTAAAIGVALIPNYIDHYMLPMLLPLAVAAAPSLARGGIGPAYALFAMLLALMAGPSLDFATRQFSREAMARLVTDIAARDRRPRLFVFQGPVYLYSAFRSTPPTPLAFPMHLSYLPEKNTSHLDTVGEVRKALAWQPTVIVQGHGVQGNLLNRETAALVESYRRRCRFWFTRTVGDYYNPYQVDVYGDCAPSAS